MVLLLMQGVGTPVEIPGAGIAQTGFRPFQLAVRGERQRGQHRHREGLAVGIIAFVILGLLAGVIAKALMPGSDPGGFIVTALIGVAGALVGGFLAGVLFDADPLDEFFDISTWLTAIAGSILLLLIYRFVVDRGHGSPARR
jgi:uncharacterized membrane protein YeaQ/YmgE (transglycosylase-associated protein family)